MGLVDTIDPEEDKVFVADVVTERNKQQNASGEKREWKCFGLKIIHWEQMDTEEEKK